MIEIENEIFAFLWHKFKEPFFQKNKNSSSSPENAKKFSNWVRLGFGYLSTSAFSNPLLYLPTSRRITFEMGSTTSSVCINDEQISKSVISAYSPHTDENSLRDSSRSSTPVVIYVHGMYGCYLSKKNGESSLFTTGFELPSSAIKSFLLGKNGHGDIALPITWLNSTDGYLVQDKDDIHPSDDFREYFFFF